MAVLIVAKHNNQELDESTAKTVSAAAQLGDEMHLLVAGKDCGAAAAEGAKIKGVAKVIQVEGEAYGHRLAEPLSLLIAKVAEPYSHVFAPSITSGKNVMPRVAALLDVMIVPDVQEVVDAETFVRPFYAGNAIQTVKSKDAKKVITVRGTSFEAPGEQDPAPIETAEPAEDPGLSEWIEDMVASTDRPELTSARIVISGGRGVASKENFELIEKVADKLGAAIGASRAAVDSGYAPNDWQVGQTGKVVAPDLYIAVGISGAIQHLAGMKDSRVIVAINKDEEAPIFQVADYGLVADLFQALPELESELGKG